MTHRNSSGSSGGKKTRYLVLKEREWEERGHQKSQEPSGYRYSGSSFFVFLYYFGKREGEKDVEDGKVGNHIY